MKAAMLNNNIVTNIIVVDGENFRRLKRNGYTVLASEELGLELGDSTADGTMFYRNVPVYDENGEQTGMEKPPLPLDDYEYADRKAALAILGVEV